MSAKVTQSRPRSFREKRIAGCRVYVNCNATSMIDSWFNENEVWSLQFKCKTWAKVKNHGTRATITELRKVFGSDAKISYSRNAGCSCGCSPGYIVSNMPVQYQNSDVWVDVKADVSALTKKLPFFTTELKKEITENN